MIYFDYSATTPVHPDVAQSIQEVMTRYYGNPSSLHKLGVEAERLVARARQQIADLLAVPSNTIIFTSGGSESNNLAIKGAVTKVQGRGKHIITSAVEHASVYEVCQQLERNGYELTVLPVDSHGRVQPEQVEAALRNDTVLVSIMMVNNEIGTIQPIQSIASVLRKHPKVMFHVDAVQAFGKIPVYPEKLGVDLLSLSAHKARGPKGAGVLYKREGIRLEPLITGGGQEGGWRSGTENVPAIVGTAKAFRYAAEQQQEAYRHVSELHRRLLKKLAAIRELAINSPLDETYAVPHIVNVSCTGIKSEVVVHALEQQGCFISSRSACSSKEDKPSRVLLALGLPADRAISGLRISLAQEHSEHEVDRLGEALQQVIAELKQVLGQHL